MTNEQTQRELAFIQYLDALEKGDAEAITTFLEQVESDPELEEIMLNYHDEDQQEKPKVITPFKLKRDHTRRWLKRFGGGLVAAILMLAVGITGLLIGLNANQGSSELIADPISGICQATIADGSNTLTLLAGQDLAEPITIGINRPMTVMLNQDADTYTVIYDGIRAEVSREDISLINVCEDDATVQLYPSNDITQNCEVDIERLQFPMRSIIADSDVIDHAFIDASVGYDILVLDEAADGHYPIISEQYQATIPEHEVRTWGDCLNYPLLYVPSRNVRDDLHSTYVSELDDDAIIDLSAMQVVEQQFENGVIYYLEAVNQYWVAYRAEQGWQRWTVVDGNLVEAMVASVNIAPPEGLHAPDEAFLALWSEGEHRGVRFNASLGWATSTLNEHLAHYAFKESSGYGRFHELGSRTDYIYRFYEGLRQWDFITDNDN